jgi:predicted nucleotidyltransferase
MIKENVGNLLKEMIQGVNYKEIILFGSRARGDFSEKSDHDILILRRMKNHE